MTESGAKPEGSSLGLRWLSAAIGIPLLLYLTHLGGIPFAAVILLLALIGLRELLSAFNAAGIRPNPILGAAGLLSPAWPLLAGPSPLAGDTVRVFDFLPAILTGILILAFSVELWRAGRTGELLAGRDAAYGALCGAYIALFGGLGYLREGFAYTLPGGSGRMEAGALLVFLTLLCVWATDSFAFFTGKAIGKHKLAPALSPNKTVEGALGGLAAALIAGALFGQILLGKPVAGIAVGAIAGTLGQAGDLFESALKREIGVKDLGGIIPGHGGVLDRFDSLLFVAPVAAIIARWIL